jgi:anti-sigma-K factor RskA
VTSESHRYWDELAAGYALHGLAPDERVQFVEHLSTCEDCEANLREHEIVAAQLGSIAHFREPEAEAPSWESMRRAIVESDATEPEVADLSARRRRHETSRRWLAAAAAAVVLAGGGIATWQLTTGGSSNCSASANCHVISLDASGGRRAASLVVRGSKATMTPVAMPAAPPGNIYVLWQAPSDGPVIPVGEFTAAPGASPVTITLKAPYTDTQQFAVSLEKSAGAPPAMPSNLLATGMATA